MGDAFCAKRVSARPRRCRACIGPTGGEGQIGLLARKAWQMTVRRADRDDGDARRKNRGSSSPMTAGLGEQPRRATAQRRRHAAASRARARNSPRRARCLHPPRRSAAKTGQQLLAACATTRRWSASSIFGISTHRSSPDGRSRCIGTDALLHLAQALETARPAAKLRIDSVTRGAQPVGREAAPPPSRRRPPSACSASSSTSTRTSSCRGIDLPPDRFGRGCGPALERTARAPMPSAKSPSAAKPATCSASTAAAPPVEQTLDPARAAAARIPRARASRHAALRAVRAAALRPGRSARSR